MVSLIRTAQLADLGRMPSDHPWEPPAPGTGSRKRATGCGICSVEDWARYGGGLTDPELAEHQGVPKAAWDGVRSRYPDHALSPSAWRSMPPAGHSRF